MAHQSYKEQAVPDGGDDDGDGDSQNGRTGKKDAHKAATKENTEISTHTPPEAGAKSSLKDPSHPAEDASQKKRRRHKIQR